METFLAKTERTYLKLLVAIPLGLFLAALLCWGGCRSYDGVQERRLVRRGAAYMSGGDLRMALLDARRAHQINEKSPGAARLIADITERAGDRTAVDWRRKVVELEPVSQANLLALAATALQFKEWKVADKALAEMSDSERQTAEYHAAMARLAAGQGKTAEAAHLWEQALRRAPASRDFELDLALSRLALGEPSARQAALDTLKTLRREPEQRAAATRALIFDGMNHRTNPADLRALARELQSYPEATFRDRILFLDLLRRLDDPEFPKYLTEVEQDAVNDGASRGTLLGWMNSSGQSLVAIDFARTLPADVVSKWPVAFHLATAHANLEEWHIVEQLLRGDNWGRNDFLRHAFKARAFRATGQTVAAEREWTTATKDAAAEGDTLLSLARTIGEWGWSQEIVDLLWTLTKFPDKQPKALATLYSHYTRARDTQGLYRVFSRMVETNPNDLDILNNLTQVSLLLGAEPDRMRILAAETHRKDPANPAYLSTYAFSLFSKGEARAAADAMAQLSDAQLREPAIGVYYGIFLAGAGEAAKAKTYLDLAQNVPVLPQENAMIEQARQRIESRQGSL